MSAGPESVPCADKVKPDLKVLTSVKFLYDFTELVKKTTVYQIRLVRKLPVAAETSVVVNRAAREGRTCSTSTTSTCSLVHLARL